MTFFRSNIAAGWAVVRWSSVNMQIGVARTGLILGIVISGWHLCWSLLVAMGWAQPVIDFVFWMHFITPIYVIEPFEFGRAILLLVVTAAVGFIFGSVFALTWNALHKA
jgi:hypothetical protein